MSDCDALKLIDEYIKNSRIHHQYSPQYELSNYRDPSTDLYYSQYPYHQSHMTSIDSTNQYFPQSAAGVRINGITMRSGSDYQKEPDALIETPPESPIQICLTNANSKTIATVNGDTNNGSSSLSTSPPQKPTRPYSYYVATNFHPFDLSILCQQLEEAAAAAATNNTTAATAASTATESSTTAVVATKTNKKSVKKNKKRQRLSVSLCDIKTSNNNRNQPNQQQQLNAAVNVESSKNSNSSGSKKSNGGELFKLNGEKKKKSKSNHHVNKVDGDDEAGKNRDSIRLQQQQSLGGFMRSTGLTATMPVMRSNKLANRNNNDNINNSMLNRNSQNTTTTTMTSGHHQHQHNSNQPISGKINRFFRQLFRVSASDKIPSPTSIVEEEEVCRKFYKSCFFPDFFLFIKNKNYFE